MIASALYFITPADLLAFTDRILQQKPICASQQRPDQPGHYWFDWLHQAEDMALNYTATTLPPKKAIIPPSEPLFTFECGESGEPPALTPFYGTEDYLLVGVHPCDLAGLDMLEQAYNQPPADGRWAANRQCATVIGVDCLPDDYCFCHSMGTAGTRSQCDLFLTPLEDGYLIEVYSSAGADLLKGAPVWEANQAQIRAAKDHLRRKQEMMSAAISADFEQIAGILAERELGPLWEAVAKRCYSCGSCNTTCPACFCFKTRDAFALNFKKGQRSRVWDSCQLEDFAVVAGGFNYREKRWQRVRHRWQRKFLYLYRQFGRPYCTGCGRCSRACTADINMAEITNRIAAYG